MKFHNYKIWFPVACTIAFSSLLWHTYKEISAGNKPAYVADIQISDSLVPLEYLPSCIDSGIFYESNLLFPLPRVIDFSQKYGKLPGIFTFRGGPYRNHASLGNLHCRPDSIRVMWVFVSNFDTAKQINGQDNWYGGCGWTGQACLVEWSKTHLAVFDSMFLPYRNADYLREVIIGSLNGKIYFFDLSSGKQTRPPIDTRNPIKGSVSLIPAERPFLFAGQGIPYTSSFGFRIFDLASHNQAFYQTGRDAFSYRGWAAFDSSPLMDFENNILYCPGENGILYQVSLNNDSTIFLVNRFRYLVKNTRRGGIESSMCAYKNLAYFTDNNGTVICLDLTTLKPVWINHNGDDTDASPVLEVQKNIPYLYSGCEVDIQDSTGKAKFRKYHGLTGHLIWENSYPCYSEKGSKPVNGGMLATPLLGKNKASNLIVLSLARYQSKSGGFLIALDKATGKELYRVKLNSYSWSSPLDLYDLDGNMYIFTADAGGRVYLIDGLNGEIIYSKNMGCTFEASPVAWDNKVVLGARGSNIYCFSIE